MTQITTITAMLLCFISATAFSQAAAVKFQTTIIEPYPLKITVNKTTNLIFPYGIKSVDRGSADVLAQKAKGVENILLVKAARENFSETNLSVITADGKLYSFILNYLNNPSVINIFFKADTSKSDVQSSLTPPFNEAAMQLNSSRIVEFRKKIHGVKDDRYEVDFSITGIFIKDNVIFFKIEIANNSNINYDVDMLKFFIKDQQRSKRTATQVVELQPIYVHGDTSIVKGYSKNIIVFALPKFTLLNKKILSIELMERNGGRNMQVALHNRVILKARSI